MYTFVQSTNKGIVVFVDSFVREENGSNYCTNQRTEENEVKSFTQQLHAKDASNLFPSL